MFAQLCISNLMVICKLTKITCFKNEFCGVYHKRKQLSLIGDKVKSQLDNTIYNYFSQASYAFCKNCETFIKHVIKEFES
jgi:hypothetical protein